MARTKSKSSELSSIIDQIEAGLKHLKSFSETVNAALADSDTLAKLTPDLIRLAEALNPPEPPEPPSNIPDTPAPSAQALEPPKSPKQRRSRKISNNQDNSSSESSKDESEEMEADNTPSESDEQSNRGPDLESQG